MSSPPSEKPNAPLLWQTLQEYEQLQPGGSVANPGDEFPSDLVTAARLVRETKADANRRTFFKMMGLSTTAAMTACKRAPVKQIVAAQTASSTQVPGTVQWYATACGACPARCGLLVKTRDGRPIKIEGNPQHPVSRGAVCVVGQASILGLYDSDRSREPSVGGKKVAWQQVDAHVEKGLAKTVASDKGIRLVVPWGLGPSAWSSISAFGAAHGGTRAVVFDPTGILDARAEANRILNGKIALPDIHWEMARTLVSFASDFLGAEDGPAGNARAWADARQPLGKIGRERLYHIQFESNLTLTGTVADERYPYDETALSDGLVALTGGIAQKLVDRSEAFAPWLSGLGVKADAPTSAPIAAAVERLVKAGASAMVVCGGANVRLHLLTALCNAMLGNQSTTVRPGVPLPDSTLLFREFLAEIVGESVGAVLFVGTNPAYAVAELAARLSRVELTVSTAARRDETAELCHVHAPEHHYLEDWGDSEPRARVMGLQQPCVAPLFNTRSFVGSLLAWSGHASDVYDHLSHAWQERLVPASGAAVELPTDAGTVSEPLRLAWEGVLRAGVFEAAVSTLASKAGVPVDAGAALAALPAPAKMTGDLNVVLFPTVALRDGGHANNGWLQEVPDPVAKLTWGNVAAMSPSLAKRLGFSEGEHVTVSVGTQNLTLPAFIQPGLAEKTVAIAVGFGRTAAGRIGNAVGKNAFLLRPWSTQGYATALSGSVTIATGRTELSIAQTHGSQEGRGIARWMSLEEVLHPGQAHPKHGSGHGTHSLWPKHAYTGHRWGLAIDLDRCTGCSACIVSCQAENNIPVVGALEVRRRREMHWLRLDRYYEGDPQNPRVITQPMLCQHCENAPCETVCPVLATVHSPEGLNQQIYNRCVGTRYCANNCPTKVRRFNWFDYPHDEPLERMVLNPDVVVRTRGVMEKCSMCVHRIETARKVSHRNGRGIEEGDIQTACQQSCPTQAIVFGDLNDPKSAVSVSAHDKRAYRILDDINIGAVVTYLSRVQGEVDDGT